MGVELPESAISVNGLVDKYIGSAYDNVVEVGMALPLIDDVADDLHYFVRTYYGPRSSFPSYRPNGEPTVEGDLFYNTNDNSMYVFAETDWVVFSSTLTQREVITIDPLVHHTDLDTVVTLNLGYMPGENAVLVFQNGQLVLQTHYVETGKHTLTFPGVLLEGGQVLEVLSVSAVNTVSPHISVQKQVYLTEIPYQTEAQLPHGMTYVPGNHNLEVYVDGRLRTVGLHYTELDNHTVRFLQPIVAQGTEITFKKGNLLSNVDLNVSGISPNYPSQVTGLTGIGLLSAIQLHWDEAQYLGHTHSEVWRSADTELANAILIQTLPSYVFYFADTVQPGTTYTYWVRFINLLEEKGPFSVAETVSSVSSPTELLALLQGQLTTAHLAASLTTRLDKIDSPVTGLTDQLAVVDAKAVSILDLTMAPDSALALALDSIEVKADNAQASADDLISLQVAPNSALALKFAGIDTKLVLPVGETSVSSALASLQQSIVGVDGAIAQQIDQLSVIYGGQSVTLQELSAVTAGINNTYAAQWSVKTDVAGLLGGVGFFNDGITTKFLVSASNFEVLQGITRTSVFAIDGAGNTIINSAMIDDAYINNLVAEVISTNQLNTNDLHITGGSISMNNGAFAVSPLGAVTANDLTVTGGELSLGGGAFHVDNNGAASMSNLTVTGGDVSLTSDHFTLTNPDTLQDDLYWDSASNTLTLRGKLILQDNTVVTSLDDLRGADGDTVYVEYQYGATTTGPWHTQPLTGDVWVQQRIVTNGIAGYWSASVRWQGVQGVQGADGTDHYTWIKYANDASGTGLSDLPDGKTYIGLAYNKTTATESTNPADYSWGRFLGPQGVAGATGANGLTTYTWIKYADDASGTGMSDSPTGKNYMGLAVNKTTQVESTVATDYVWSLTKGATGATGATGAQGIQGIRGAGRYTIGVARNPVTWSNTDAVTAIGANPVEDDVVTQISSTNAASQITQRWNGSAWVAFSLQVHGDALVDGTLVASKLVAGTITGDKISAGTINAGHLAVGDFANLVVDSNGDSGVSPFSSSYSVGVGNGTHAYRCVEGARDSVGNLMPVESEEQYYFSADMSWVSGAQTQSGIGLAFYDANGNATNWIIGAACTTYNSSAWTRVTGVVTVPSGYYRAAIWWQRDGFGVEGCGVWNMRNLQIRKRIDGGDLIVAGTITGDRLVANTITGSYIAASTITGSKIAADTITASNIAAGTITASKIAAGTITGDRIAASQTLSSPSISGGSITLGSGDNITFAEGGYIGIGRGGPYSAWGWGWHTLITNNGTLYTDRLQASSGSFTGTVNANAGTFNNVTINSNCDVKGTIYADKIVGDVVAITNYNIPARSSVQTTTLLSGTVLSHTKNRLMMFTDIRITRFSTVEKTLQVSIYVDGVQVWHGQAGSATDGSYTANPPPLSIASGANRSFSISVYTSDNSYLSIPAQDIQCTVAPTSSGTFA